MVFRSTKSRRLGGEAQCEGKTHSTRFARGASFGHSLVEYCNAVAGHHRDALRVSLSTPTDCVAPLDKGIAIACEARLA